MPRCCPPYDSHQFAVPGAQSKAMEGSKAWPGNKELPSRRNGTQVGSETEQWWLGVMGGRRVKPARAAPRDGDAMSQSGPSFDQRSPQDTLRTSGTARLLHPKHACKPMLARSGQETHAVACCARNQRTQATGVKSPHRSHNSDRWRPGADSEARSTHGAWRTVDHSSAPPPSSVRRVCVGSPSHRAVFLRAVLPVARVTFPGLTPPPFPLASAEASAPPRSASSLSDRGSPRIVGRLARRAPTFELHPIPSGRTSSRLPESRTETPVPRRRTVVDAIERGCSGFQRRRNENKSSILQAVTAFRKGRLPFSSCRDAP